MTEEEIKDAQALCEAATPGLDSPSAAPGWCWAQLAENVFEVQRCQAWTALFKRQEDAQFIAKSRTLLPATLAEIVRLRAALVWARTRLLDGGRGETSLLGIANVLAGIEDALAGSGAT